MDKDNEWPSEQSYVVKGCVAKDENGDYVICINKKFLPTGQQPSQDSIYSDEKDLTEGEGK